MRKVCTKCDIEKDITEFAKRYEGYQPYCKQCNREKSAKYYANNKKRHIKNIVRRNTEQQKVYITWKMNLSCQICGEDYGPCLDFHHVNPDEKEFVLAGSVTRVGFKKTIEEIKKCVVVCRNCHTKIHDGIVDCPSIDQTKNIELLEEMIENL